MNAKKELEQIAAKQLLARKERENRLTIIIDTPPQDGQYIEVRTGNLVDYRLQPPKYGTMTLTFHEGKLAKIDTMISERIHD